MNDKTQPQSHLFLNADGYVEIVFRGIVYHDIVQELVRQATVLIEENGPINVLIDGRFGAVDRKAKTFRVLMGLGRVPKMKNIIILTSNDPTEVHSIQGPSIVTSMLSTAFGFKPAYIADEAEARAMTITN